jgi:hypothetical protein
MKRQVRRRIKRSWDKIPSIMDCEGRLDFVKLECFDKVFCPDLPYTAVDLMFKVREDFLLEYNVNMYKRWRLILCVVTDGESFRFMFFDIGVVSDEWLARYFDDDALLEDFDFVR